MKKNHKRTLYIIAYYSLIFILICVFTISYVAAKFKTELPFEHSSAVKTFAPRLVITNSDELFSFSNVSSDLSHPKDATFEVRNFTDDKITEVDLKYSLVFYIPADTFANTAMFQIMSGSGSSLQPITPLYSAIDLKTGVAHTTELNRYKEYVTISDERLTPSTTPNTYDVTKISDNSNVGTIKVETVNIDTKYYLLFNCWTEDGKTLLDPTIKVDLQSELTYLKITINRPEFVLNGGTKKTDSMSLRLIPSSGMTEDNNPLDSELHTSWDSLLGKLTSESLSMIDIADPNETWEINYDSSNHNTINITKKYIVNGVTHTEVFNNVLVGNIQTLSDGTIKRISSGKGYPCRLNILFEQLPPTSSGS